MGIGILPFAILLAATAGPEVEYTTLQGERQMGRLLELSADTLTMQVDGADRDVPLSQLMEVRFPSSSEFRRLEEPAMKVRLRDGSQFRASRLEVSGADAILGSDDLGEFSVPRRWIASIRIDTADSQLDTEWDELRNREARQDMLVVRNKNNVLDHLSGVIGEIDDKSVKFLIDGNEVDVKRDRIYGIVYARQTAQPPKSTCQIDLAGFDFLHAARIAWDGEQLTARLGVGGEVKLPLEKVRSLDFSQGKVRYLSQMEPREYKFTPYFDDDVERELFHYRRDRNQEGGPLRLGGKTYNRGLWIHSRTFLRYRINGEYRRFQAVMGIDEGIARYRMGDVHVVISGDGKSLLTADVRGSDDPKLIDLDVTGVRDLEILVDFGGNQNICDHLDLADAKVIK
jgi:hypothetical protein